MDSGHNVRAYEMAGMGYDKMRADRLERENKQKDELITELTNDIERYSRWNAEMIALLLKYKSKYKDSHLSNECDELINKYR